MTPPGAAGTASDGFRVPGRVADDVAGRLAYAISDVGVESVDHAWKLAAALLPVVDAIAEERAAEALRATVARVRSMRDVATDGKVTVAAIDWALGDLP